MTGVSFHSERFKCKSIIILSLSCWFIFLIQNMLVVGERRTQHTRHKTVFQLPRGHWELSLKSYESCIVQSVENKAEYLLIQLLVVNYIVWTSPALAGAIAVLVFALNTTFTLIKSESAHMNFTRQCALRLIQTILCIWAPWSQIWAVMQSLSSQELQLVTL